MPLLLLCLNRRYMANMTGVALLFHDALLCSYDPRTLYVPPEWFKTAKVSPGQQQWWEFKAANFDSVLLFKMGKFYEMFEMDAHIAVETLGLSYMKVLLYCRRYREPACLHASAHA